MAYRLRTLICILVCLSSSALAATSEGAPGAAGLQKISFRTQRPSVLHLKTEKEASKTTNLLKQIGCEMQTKQHDGHIDVNYECRFWKSITLKTLQEVAQWDAWLTSKSFVVVHNTPAKDHKEVVQYRLPKWGTFHFKTEQEMQAYQEMFKMLGCETKKEKHGDHEDVMARCASWAVIGVPNHNEAHAWMGVLKKLGFEVRHEH